MDKNPMDGVLVFLSICMAIGIVGMFVYWLVARVIL